MERRQPYGKGSCKPQLPFISFWQCFYEGAEAGITVEIANKGKMILTAETGASVNSQAVFRAFASAQNRGMRRSPHCGGPFCSAKGGGCVQGPGRWSWAGTTMQS